MLEYYIDLLKSGEAVAFPTETVYGLGADAQKPTAVHKIFAIKGRPTDNPLIVHISSLDMLNDLVEEVPVEAKQLIDAFWPGPLTLIFKKKPHVLDIVTGGLPTVAVRWPSHPLSQDLIARVGPLVAPSANSSGKPSPTKPEHIKEDFGQDFPIIEAGETQIGLESTVLDVSQKPFQLYRPGQIGQSKIEDIISSTIEIPAPVKDEIPKSPGTKYSHYAPQASVHWLNDYEAFDAETTLYLLHSFEPGQDAANIIFFEKDYKEMAHQLYDRFRQADHDGYTEIRIEPFSDELKKTEPLADALYNRISKAIG